VTAALLHATLGRGPTPGRWRLLIPATVGAAGEEIVWRWGALAGTAPVLGWAGALIASTLGFAFRHARPPDRAVCAYLLLGGAFGAVFLATGRLAAAIAAHAAYNALVLVRASA
jgi:membrane protease YdiL (CAAX protease family)